LEVLYLPLQQCLLLSTNQEGCSEHVHNYLLSAACSKQFARSLLAALPYVARSLLAAQPQSASFFSFLGCVVRDLPVLAELLKDQQCFELFVSPADWFLSLLFIAAN